MIIELKGVGTLNKGAYLMLLAILKYFEKNHGDKKITFVSQFGYNFPREKGKEFNIKPLIKTKRRGIEFNPYLNLLPKKIRHSQNLYLPRDVDVVLDGSGFVYGDQWPVKDIIKILSGKINYYKSNNTKVILLPQAFGPFTRPKIQEEVKKVVKKADLVFARDTKSFAFLENTFGKQKNIHLAPDFTNILEGVEIENKFAGKVLIIPNIKLLQQTEISEEALKNAFKTMIESTQNKGFSPSFLIHEGKKDENLAHAINDILDKKIPIIIEPDALKQKAIISQAYVVITGRFHGLVSSLSQSVPSIGLSWSHKYEMLLKDYNQERFLLNLNSKDPESMLEDILLVDNNNRIREELKSISGIEKARTLEMWRKVENEIFA
jgi:polysaccharide pyruvyl transferase WcaK-like protein